MATTREWLLDDTPASRLQARLGRSYRIWLALLGNPLAVAGAVIVLALILMALFAPFIATHSPTSQNLSLRLMADPRGPDVLLCQDCARAGLYLPTLWRILRE